MLGREVLHLDSKGRVLEDGLLALLLLPVQDVLLLDPLRKPGDVLAALDLAAAGQVLQGEDLIVLHAPMSHSKGDAGGVLGGGPHHVG
ncbi:MAG: hypothetical protein ACK56F_09520 [bacterium]